ncbi:MAG: hypothetical protein AAGK14_00965 [Verrucomicrobiota bacterium]
MGRERAEDSGIGGGRCQSAGPGKGSPGRGKFLALGMTDPPRLAYHGVMKHIAWTAPLLALALLLAGCNRGAKEQQRQIDELRQKMEQLEHEVREAAREGGGVTVKVTEEGEARLDPVVGVQPRLMHDQELPSLPSKPGMLVEDRFLEIYILIRDADDLKARGEYERALRYFEHAREALDKLPKGFFPAIIDYRKDYCDEMIRKLKKILEKQQPPG